MSFTRHKHNQVRLTVELLEVRCLLSAGPRTINGTDNNPLNFNWGAADTQLLRDFTVGYGDGISSPAGAGLPSARAVSNAVLAQSESLLSGRHLSAMVFQWGQFLDHDMDLTDNAAPAEPFQILVPVGDPHFDPLSIGGQVIPLNRSAYDPTTGIDTPRQQMNAITAFIDASNVYGSDQIRADALRTWSGGKLKTSAGDLLPFNVDGLPNAGGPGAELFLAGDVRANEQVGLTALHTLFVREHNRLADEIAVKNPGWSDEQIYQRARKIVGAQLQVITYNEFLPAVLGPNKLGAYKGYDSSIDPGISNLFSTAAFRVGHTMLTSQLLRLDNNGNEITEGNLALRDAFFRPDRIQNEGGIDPLLKGLAEQVQQEIDAKIIDDVRNFLFGSPGQGGFDLASLNIQRGRDHGMPSYNQARVDMGLAPAASFADITSDVNVQVALASIYANVNEVDVWVGGIAEDHLSGSSLGELFTTVWVDQFTRLRAGDRFWYENDSAFSKGDLAHLKNTTLADIILRNTEITELHPHVFFHHAHNGGAQKQATGTAIQLSSEVTRSSVTASLDDNGTTAHPSHVHTATALPPVGSMIINATTPQSTSAASAGFPADVGLFVDHTASILETAINHNRVVDGTENAATRLGQFKGLTVTENHDHGDADGSADLGGGVASADTLTFIFANFASKSDNNVFGVLG